MYAAPCLGQHFAIWGGPGGARTDEAVAVDAVEVALADFEADPADHLAGALGLGHSLWRPA